MFEENAASSATRLLRWGWPAVSGALFAAFATLGLLISRSTADTAALWLPNAILLTALIVAPRSEGWRYAATCGAASLLANWMGGTAIPLAAAFTAANLIGVGLSFRLLCRREYGRNTLDTAAGLYWFALSIGCGVSAGGLFAAAAIWATGGAFGEAWFAWTASDLLGSALVPLLALSILRGWNERDQRSGPLRLDAALWLLASVTAVTVLVFSQSRFPALFVPLAVVLVVTYRLGLFGAVAGTGIVAVVGSGFITAGHGPIALIAGTTALRIQFFQFYLVTMLITSLPLAALLAERSRMTRDKIESDRRHRRILDQSREVIFETDLKGRWTYLNPAWEALTGRAAADSLGESFLSVIAAEDRETALARLAPLYEREIDECYQDVRYLHVDGTVRWASVRSHLLEDHLGAIVGTYGTLHDVNERVAAETALAESERLYRLLADNSNDMIVRLSFQGVRRYVSPASRSLLGYEPEEMVGSPAAGAIHPDDRAVAIATCETLLEGAENPICTYRQRRKDGSYVWLEASYRLIRNPATGAPEEFIASVRDVSRRQRAELERAELAAQTVESNRLLFMAEEMGGVGHWRFDVASAVVFWSDTVCDIHGHPRGYSPPLESAIEAYHPEDRPKVEGAVQCAIQTGLAYEFTARLIRADGAVRQVVSQGRPEVGPDGTVTGLFGVFQDVTEVFDAQQALKEARDGLADSNRMLMMAEAVAHVGHWRVDRLGGSHFWSDEVYRIYGIDQDVPPTFERVDAAYHPDDRDRARSAFAAATATGAGIGFRARIVRTNGELAHIVVRGEVDRDEEGGIKGMFGIVQDITEQAEAEAQLREREAKFRLITEEASDMISVHDVAGRCTFMSPAARSVLGYDPDELLGTTADDLVIADDHHVLRAYRQQVRSAGAGGVSTVRVRMRRADDSSCWIEIASRMTQLDDKTCIISVCRDADRQVAAEEALRLARAEAEAAAHAKSGFLANMSHEIRTPMNGVIGFTELLLASDLDAEQRRQTELIAESGRAMMRLLNDILDLSKVDAGQMQIADEAFDLHQALESCGRLIAPALAQNNVPLIVDFAEGLPRLVCGDGLRIRQIVVNLLGNAAKFTTAGSVTLAARAEERGPDVPVLVIDVIDSGIGIPPERQAAIFEAFVQADAGTAGRFGGTGLGLSISARLATLMGGALTLTSAPGEGSCFTLTLPLVRGSECAENPVLELAPDSVGSDPENRSLRVLVAEDHDINQMLVTAMLTRLRCEVVVAPDGAQAVAMVKAARSGNRPFDIVLMDTQMPVLDGPGAARRIREAGIDAEELPIVALTANAFADDVAVSLTSGMQAHIAKPVTLAQLESALQRWARGPIAALPQTATSSLPGSVGDRYVERREATLAAVDALLRRGRFEGSELKSVADLLHKLAGTAGMFGESLLGDEARALEIGLEKWPAEERNKRIATAAKALRRAKAGIG